MDDATQSGSSGSPGAFVVRYTPRYEDTFKVQRQSIRYHYSLAQRYLPWLILLLLAAAIGLIIYFDRAIIAAFRGFAPPLVAAWSPPLLMVFAYLIWVYGYCYGLAPRLAARWLSQRSAPLPTTLEIDGDRLIWQSEVARGEVAMRGIERLFSSKTGVCMIVSNTTMFVPHDAFETAADRKAFVGVVLSKMTDAARERSERDRSVKRLLAVSA